MPVAAFRQRMSRRSLIPAITVAGVLVLGVVIQAAVASNATPGVATPVFPREVAAYSWWTGMLSSSSIDAATMVYQNGAGVELSTPRRRFSWEPTALPTAGWMGPSRLRSRRIMALLRRASCLQTAGSSWLARRMGEVESRS